MKSTGVASFAALTIIPIGEDVIWNLLQSIFVFIQFSFLIYIAFTSPLLLGGKKSFGFICFFPAGINTLNNHAGKVKLIQGLQCSLPKKPPARIYSVLNYSLEKFNRLLYKQRAKACQQWSQSDCAAPLCLPALHLSRARMLNQFN